MSGVTILDYGVGNLRSLSRAFEEVGVPTTFASDPAGISRGDPLILPGVGAFPHCVERLHRLGLAEELTEAVGRGRPLLGICVGMQLLFDVGHEFGTYAGLGLLRGSVERIPITPAVDGRLPKLPHIGWAPLQVSQRGEAGLFGTTPPGTRQYFLHSYGAKADDQEIVAATTSYGGATVCAAVSHGSIHGVQFHPEKSGPAGLEVLAGFCRASGLLGARSGVRIPVGADASPQDPTPVSDPPAATLAAPTSPCRPPADR
jgi:imidazole glycerol-phosphate synthase subunit HisH